jgi:hypothetical protein
MTEQAMSTIVAGARTRCSDGESCACTLQGFVIMPRGDVRETQSIVITKPFFAGRAGDF